MKNYDMVYDVAIIGNGIEAASAAAHCSRSKAKTVLINLPEIQGDDLENLKLIHRLTQQARESGTKVIQCSVHSVWCKHFPKIIYTEEGSIMCKCIILAMNGLLNISALAPNTFASFVDCRTTKASIRVLQWFGAMITAPSVGMFSLPWIHVFLYPFHVHQSTIGFSALYRQSS